MSNLKEKIIEAIVIFAGTESFVSEIECIVHAHCEWISVDDALPINDVEVLVRVDRGDSVQTTLSYYLERKEVWNCAFKGTVTHWQPLPHPPKEK